MSASMFRSAAIVLGAVLMIAVQVQMDFFASPTYIGLRINIADLMVPAGGLCILASLIGKSSAWPQFKSPIIWPYLALLTLIMTGALFTGYMTTGIWSGWAVTNKYAGWYIMLALFLWGAWLRTNLSDDALIRLLKIFSSAGLIIAALGISCTLLRSAGLPLPDRLMPYPLAGFMANRNAYAMFICCLAALLAIFHWKKQPLVPEKILMAAWFLLPLCLGLAGSRTSWMCLPLLSIGLIILARGSIIRPVILPAVAGLVLIGTLAISGSINFSRDSQMELLHQLPAVIEDGTSGNFSSEAQQKYSLQSDVKRLQVIHDALDLWRTYPIFGAGLGAFLDYQDKKYGHHINIIDNSALWLLAETGLAGALAFAGFYLLIIIRLGKTDSEPLNTALSTAMIGMMLIFAFFSLFHEMIYTRFLWVFLGLSMGLPKRHHPE